MDTQIVALAKLQPYLGTTWFWHLIIVMTIFAWAFFLRCSEYTKNKYTDAPKVTDISFGFSDSGTKILNFALDRRKNAINIEIEPISIPCSCKHFKLCGYHTMTQYFKDRTTFTICRKAK